MKESDEPAALCALHYFHKIQGKGYALVPEHVETRPLYSPAAPGIEQVNFTGFLFNILIEIIILSVKNETKIISK